MNNKTWIKKQSGELEAFSKEKLKRSLQHAGADEEAAEQIASELESWLYEGVRTKEIYKKAFSLLRRRQSGLAARYKLKNAMMELGPTGYPFESFIGELFRRQGFEVEVGKVVQGDCVTHEVDVIATKGKVQYFIECKYYLHTGKNANVQVPMYIRSRVDDIVRYRSQRPDYKDYTFHGGVVTNTRFTADAISFGECTGLHLLSWDYPAGKGLKEWIDREHLFPVTVLTRLTKADKQALIEKGIVLCSQLIQQPDILDTLGFSLSKKRKVEEELRFLCPYRE